MKRGGGGGGERSGVRSAAARKERLSPRARARLSRTPPPIRSLLVLTSSSWRAVTGSPMMDARLATASSVISAIEREEGFERKKRETWTVLSLFEGARVRESGERVCVRRGVAGSARVACGDAGAPEEKEE